MIEGALESNKKEAGTPAGVERASSGKVYSPAVNIVERANDLVLTADMPGVCENSVDITLEKKILTIAGHIEPQEDKYCLLHEEYGVGDYERSFTLSDEVDGDHIEASVKNGVLKLILPKAEKAKTKKILVKAEA